MKEAGKRSCGPTNRNRIQGGAEQGERVGIGDVHARMIVEHVDVAFRQRNF